MQLHHGNLLVIICSAHTEAILQSIQSSESDSIAFIVSAQNDPPSLIPWIINYTFFGFI